VETCWKVVNYSVR